MVRSLLPGSRLGLRQAICQSPLSYLRSTLKAFRRRGIAKLAEKRTSFRLKRFTSPVASQQGPAELVAWRRRRRSSEVRAHARYPAVRRSLFTLDFIVVFPRSLSCMIRQRLWLRVGGRVKAEQSSPPPPPSEAR